MQIQRMFSEKIYSGKKVEFDNEGRLRMGDFELREDVQNKDQLIIVK